MSLTTTATSVTYTLSTVPQTLAVPFQFYSYNEINVTCGGVALDFLSGWAVSGGGYNSQNELQTGSVVIAGGGSHSSVVVPGATVVISRVTDAKQSASFTTGGMLTPLQLEAGLDRVTALYQEAKTEIESIASGVAPSTVINVNTVADLRAYDVTSIATGTTVNVLGYYAAGDGGGGLFRYDSASVAADNSGTVIGKFLRQFSGPLNVRWFGARGDGATNDTTIINNAITVAATTAPYYSLFFPSGTYMCNGVSVRSGVELFGIKNDSVIKFNGSFSYNFILKNSGLGSNTDARIYIHDLTFDGAGAWYPTAGANGGGTPLINIDGVTNFIFENNRVTNYQYVGLSATSITGGRICGNEFDNIGYTGAASGTPINDNFGSALYVGHVGGVVSTGVIINNNYIHDCFWHGIHYVGCDGDISFNRIFNCKETGIFYPCDSRHATKPQFRNVFSHNKIKSVRLHSVSAHGIEGGAFFTQYIANSIVDVDGIGIVDNYGSQGCVYLGNYFDKCGQILSASSACLSINATETSKPAAYSTIANNIFDNTGAVAVAYGFQNLILGGTSNSAQNIVVRNNVFKVNFGTAQYIIDGGGGVTIVDNTNATDFPSPRVFTNIAIRGSSSDPSASNVVANLCNETVETISTAATNGGPCIGFIQRTGNGVDRYAAGAIKAKFESTPGSNNYSSSICVYSVDSSGNTNERLRVYGNGTIQFGVIPNSYASDALAAAGGVPVGGLYRNGSNLMIRVT